MIKTEYLNDNKLVKHYSSEGYLLLQKETGAKYSEPIDINPCPYTYIETNEYPDSETDEEEISPENFLNMLQEVL